MSRDNTGKQQEKSQIGTNNTQITADTSGRNTALGDEQGQINSLEANPGLGPDFIKNSVARNADVMDASYGGAQDAIANNAAVTGHSSDDAGLYPQEQQLAAAKARDENAQNLNYNLQDAQAALSTRQALPGMENNIAGVYGNSATALSGQNASMITGTETADNSPTFGQQLLLAGVSGASQAGAAAAGKP